MSSEAGRYRNRIVDDELDVLLRGLAAISLEGPKGVGKTSTAQHRGGSIFRLDDPEVLQLVKAQPEVFVTAERPVVIDEWQQFPPSWDVVRRAVDDDATPGRFLLTGSATPASRPMHSGAGRIVPLRIRPLTLAERGVGEPTVSFASLVSGSRPLLSGETDVDLDGYTTEILRGGFPGMRSSVERVQRAALEGYLERIVDRDLPENGLSVRQPNRLRRWLQAYAAATASTASFEKIARASTPGEEHTPARSTTSAYREALERMWILDPVNAWSPTHNHLARLSQSPKHFLADPALAAQLVGVTAEDLLRGEGPRRSVNDGPFLGALFESLVALHLHVFAQHTEAKVSHFRTWSGDREVDFIVNRGIQRTVAIEVKLTASVDEQDVAQLVWLRKKLGESLTDAIVITTGKYAYRRPDGIGVVPLALLGP